MNLTVDRYRRLKIEGRAHHRTRMRARSVMSKLGFRLVVDALIAAQLAIFCLEVCPAVCVSTQLLRRRGIGFTADIFLTISVLCSRRPTKHHRSGTPACLTCSGQWLIAAMSQKLFSSFGLGGKFGAVAARHLLTVIASHMESYLLMRLSGRPISFARANSTH